MLQQNEKAYPAERSASAAAGSGTRSARWRDGMRLKARFEDGREDERMRSPGSIDPSPARIEAPIPLIGLATRIAAVLFLPVGCALLARLRRGEQRGSARATEDRARTREIPLLPTS